jgi:hypothetical protein
MDFSKYPFGVPVDVKNAEKINDIMNTSWKIQKELCVGNACLIVNCVLRRCLKAIGVHANKIYGIFNPGALKVPHVSLKIPHVWLKIEGHVVDNTFVKDLTEPDLITMKESATYTATSVEEEEDLYLGDDVTESLGIGNHSVANFEWMFSNEDKGLVLSKNKFRFSEYFKMMTEYMLQKYKANVEQVSETVVTNCWCCNRSDIPLMTCGNCKIAKYCNRECQKNDRKIHNKQICLKPNTY